jgi:hypothetical protein
MYHHLYSCEINWIVFKLKLVIDFVVLLLHL